MKFVSYTIDGREAWGALTDAGIVDVNALLGTTHATLADYIGSADWVRRGALALAGAPAIDPAPVAWLPVIPRPEKIALLVRNYLDHHREVVAAGLNREVPKFPPVFLRVWRSQTPHEGPLVRSAVSDTLDWEGELAVVIGKPGRHIAEERALEHVAGYACYNDASIREYQFHAQQIAGGKNFEGTGGFGPWLVCSDEIPDPAGLALTVRIDGEVAQASNTSNMIFTVAQQIAYLSKIFTLVPGDVIVTGTPGGTGWNRTPPRFLKPGEVVEVEIEKIGVLRNTVVDEIVA